MGLLDWEPGERLAFWGKRTALAVILCGFWGIEASFIVVLALGVVERSIDPGNADWRKVLLYGPLWTVATILVTPAVRGEWPGPARATRSPEKD